MATHTSTIISSLTINFTFLPRQQTARTWGKLYTNMLLPVDHYKSDVFFNFNGVFPLLLLQNSCVRQQQLVCVVFRRFSCHMYVHIFQYFIGCCLF
jgi:hypothetical protein